MHAEVVRGASGRWYVKLVAANHETLSVSETFYSKWNAKRAARKLVPNDVRVKD